MERVDSGDLELELIALKGKQKPKRDWKGELLVANEMNLVRDRRFDPSDPRHKTAKTHRHITDKGLAGASGKHDPKTITTPEGTQYLLLPDTESACELCTGGDMIPAAERFRDSIYRPV